MGREQQRGYNRNSRPLARGMKHQKNNLKRSHNHYSHKRITGETQEQRKNGGSPRQGKKAGHVWAVVGIL